MKAKPGTTRTAVILIIAVIILIVTIALVSGSSYYLELARLAN